MFQENLFTLKWWCQRDSKITVGKVLSIRWFMLARLRTVVCTQGTSSTAAYTVQSHSTRTLPIPGFHQLIHTQIQIIITLISSSDGALFLGGGWDQWGRRLERAGPTRRPAWLAGGEWPGRCDFVRDGLDVPTAFSVPCRLPWQELPSCELMEFSVAVM